MVNNEQLGIRLVLRVWVDKKKCLSKGKKIEIEKTKNSGSKLGSSGTPINLVLHRTRTFIMPKLCL